MVVRYSLEDVAAAEGILVVVIIKGIRQEVVIDNLVTDLGLDTCLEFASKEEAYFRIIKEDVLEAVAYFMEVATENHSQLEPLDLKILEVDSQISQMDHLGHRERIPDETISFRIDALY